MTPPQRPRLLVLASTYPARSGDGTPAFVADLAAEQAKAFDVRVIVPMVPGAPRAERSGGVEVRRFRFFPRRWEDLADGAIIENLRARRSRWLQVPFLMLAQLAAVRNEIRRFRPDVVHAHWLIPQGLVARAAIGATPLLLTTLGGDLYALESPPLRMLKRLVARRAAHTTVMNADMRARIQAMGVPADRVSVVPMGADLSAVRRRSPEPDDGVARVLFVGRLVEKKGLANLIEALRAIDPARWRLRIVGDGPLRRELERAAAGLPVEFLGQRGRGELFAQYADADIVAFPSVRAASGDQDGLPVSMIEAMGAGCAVIASRIPGIDELVVDGRSGLLVEPGDERALSDALTRMMGDPAERRRLADGARAAAAELGVEAVGRRYVELLRRILGHG
jgi:colanic acid/amylovoran biosynthesis glycosyltransferase